MSGPGASGVRDARLPPPRKVTAGRLEKPCDLGLKTIKTSRARIMRVRAGVGARAHARARRGCGSGIAAAGGRRSAPASRLLATSPVGIEGTRFRRGRGSPRPGWGVGRLLPPWVALLGPRWARVGASRRVALRRRAVGADEPVALGPERGLRAVRDADRAEDVRQVRLHGLLADAQAHGDQLVGHPAADERQDGALALGQAGVGAVGGAGGEQLARGARVERSVALGGGADAAEELLGL